MEAARTCTQLCCNSFVVQMFPEYSKNISELFEMCASKNLEFATLPFPGPINDRYISIPGKL